MAFKKTGITFNEAANEWMEHYECDHEWEVANLPKCNPGSTVKVLDTGKEYNVGNNGLWGGGGVKSWNELNDRPFSEESGVVEVLPECQPTYSEGNLFTLQETCFDIKIGQTYIVKFNGAEYNAIALDGSAFGAYYAVLVNEGADVSTGEGTVFTIMLFDEERANDNEHGGDIVVLDGSTSVTLSIYQDNTVITPIEGKYLPKGTPYVEETEGVVEVLAETTVAFSDSVSGYAVEMGQSLIAGETYTVNWNGEEYSCVAQDAAVITSGEVEGIFLGNFGQMMGGNSTGEPFVLTIIDGEAIFMDVNDLREDVTVSVKFKGTITTIHPIDPRCLPDGIGGGSFVINGSFNLGEMTITADKTFAEVKAAYEAGVFPVALLKNNQGSTKELFYFSYVMSDDDTGEPFMFGFYSPLENANAVADGDINGWYLEKS